MTKCPYCGSNIYDFQLEEVKRKSVEKINYKQKAIEKEKEIWRPLDCEEEIHIPTVWTKDIDTNLTYTTTTDSKDNLWVYYKDYKKYLVG